MPRESAPRRRLAGEADMARALWPPLCWLPGWRRARRPAAAFFALRSRRDAFGGALLAFACCANLTLLRRPRRSSACLSPASPSKLCRDALGGALLVFCLPRHLGAAPKHEANTYFFSWFQILLQYLFFWWLDSIYQGDDILILILLVSVLYLYCICICICIVFVLYLYFICIWICIICILFVFEFVLYFYCISIVCVFVLYLGCTCIVFVLYSYWICVVFLNCICVVFCILFVLYLSLYVYCICIVIEAHYTNVLPRKCYKWQEFICYWLIHIFRDVERKGGAICCVLANFLVWI
jgi:hypothetical protein